jgi:hypothetical protein
MQINQSEKKSNADSQVILYAKGHFQKSEGDNGMWNDLRILFGERNWIPPETIHISDICTMLLMLVETYNKDNVSLSQFIRDIDPKVSYWLYSDKPWNFHASVAKKCLSILKFIKVRNEKTNEVIVHLDPPNPNLLPLVVKTNTPAIVYKDYTYDDITVEDVVNYHELED